MSLASRYTVTVVSIKRYGAVAVENLRYSSQSFDVLKYETSLGFGVAKSYGDSYGVGYE